MSEVDKAKEITRWVVAMVQAVRREERERAANLVKQYIRFDSRQNHIHSWHCLQDCVKEILEGNLELEADGERKQFCKLLGLPEHASWEAIYTATKILKDQLYDY